MPRKRFSPVAQIRTSDPAAARAVLAVFAGHGSITESEEGLRIEAQLAGETARDLNRSLLSTLRRIDRRATLRAEWTARGITQRFFDYTLRATRRA